MTDCRICAWNQKLPTFEPLWLQCPTASTVHQRVLSASKLTANIIALCIGQVTILIDDEVTASTKDTEYLASFRGRRKRLTMKDVERIAKQVAYESRMDSNDVVAIEKLVETWRGMGDNNPLLHYAPQVRMSPTVVLVVNRHGSSHSSECPRHTPVPHP